MAKTYKYYSDALYNSVLSDKQKQYILDNCERDSDGRIAIDLKIDVNYVRGFRVDKLGIIKNRNVTKNTNQLRVPLSKLVANYKDEHEALVKYDYHGSMKDSVKARILYLEKQINRNH